jgi:hypothetical protein
MIRTGRKVMRKPYIVSRMMEWEGALRLTLRLIFTTFESEIERWMKLGHNFPNVDTELFIESQREFVTLDKELVWSLVRNNR